jgi:uncharacterized protein
MRVVLDTNVVVSGLLFGGVPLKIVRSALCKEFTYVTSVPLLEEMQTVLAYKKFGLSSEEIRDLTGPLVEAAEFAVSTEEISVIERCPADNRVLECAVAGRCAAIVTGDKRDLIRLGVFRGIPILSPRAFLDSIR